MSGSTDHIGEDRVRIIVVVVAIIIIVIVNVGERIVGFVFRQFCND